MFINKAIIYGNLTRDPELKKLPNGNSVLNTSIATNRVWKDKSGEKREDVEFHNIVAFGRTAELVSQYLKKGSGVFIEGRLQTRSWETDGVKKYMTEIIVENVQFGPKSSGSTYTPPTKPAESVDKSPSKDINPEDIPF